MRILYIDCDSLRPDHLGCYGYHRDTSPNIDELAEGGRRFTNYYASDVPCLPSRTALFTGRFGIHTGAVCHGGVAADPRQQGRDRGDANDGRFRTLPTVLREQGYRTAFVSPFPQRHGAWHALDGFEDYRDTGGNGLEQADVVYDEAEAWLDRHATDDDWYLHVNFWDPHTPYDTPESFGNPFAAEPAPDWLTEGRIAAQRTQPGPHSARDLHHQHMTGDPVPDGTRAPDEITDRESFAQWIDGYDVGIRYMDRFVGKLLDRLEEAGVREETLVVLSADHGENHGELNVYGDHQLADEWTCRVPLIVDGPRVEPGRDDGLHYNVDFAPTIAERVDASIPAGWDGRSFASSLTAGEDTGRSFLVLSQGAWTCQRGVRWDDWLLVQTYHDGWHDLPALLLFDLDADPHETTNVADQHPAVVDRGLALLQRWQIARLTEDATGTAGGMPDAPRTLRDPLFEVLREGLPYYQRENRAAYADRLRATGREAYAEVVEAPDGGVRWPETTR